MQRKVWFKRLFYIHVYLSQQAWILTFTDKSFFFFWIVSALEAKSVLLFCQKLYRWPRIWCRMKIHSISHLDCSELQVVRSIYSRKWIWIKCWELNTIERKQLTVHILFVVLYYMFFILYLVSALSCYLCLCGSVFCQILCWLLCME